MSRAPLRAETFFPSVVAREASALAVGALHPIETVAIYLSDGGVEFIVRRVSSLARKAVAPASPRDPFSPYEEALFVGDLSASHFCLLNKFKVIDHHVLIVTCDYAEQQSELALEDFTALAICLAGKEGLCFYNGGAAAGASQPHKHLQWVPLPLSDHRPGVPIEALLDAAPAGIGIREVPGIPFAHALARLAPRAFADPKSFGPTTYKTYLDLLDSLGMRAPGETRDDVPRSAPFNLLLTRRFMLLVPRSRECVDGVSINALGFAGSLFVRDDVELRVVEARGPMNLLTEASRPRVG